MKRLHFRHNNTIFENREVALKYFSDIVDSNNVASLEFKSSLYAEPMVARYLDEDGNTQVIFAIGVDSGLTPYHIIDIKEVSELIAKNEALINDEITRATTSEENLQNNIDEEKKRALLAEANLSETINKEITNRTNAISNLQEQITDNISSINEVTPSSANILAEYALKNAKGEILGDNIKIYKDSSLVGSLIGFKGAESVTKNEDGTFTLSYKESERDESREYLYLVYRNEEGNLQLVGIDFENFLMEAEFKDGLSVSNHSVSVKIKDGERYLGVNESGVYTTNINEDINSAVSRLNSDLIDKIDNEITRATSKEEEIINTVKTFSGSVIDEVSKINVSINDEKTRAESAESKLQIAINDEKNRASAMENNLQSKIEAEVSRAGEAELDLQSKIEAEVLRAGEAESNLNKRITKVRTYSKDIKYTPTVDYTLLELQTDEDTITKYADPEIISKTGFNVLGTRLTIKKVTPNDNNVKLRYELQSATGKILGDAIELPVESALIGVKQGRLGDTIDVSTGNYIEEGTGDVTMNFVYRLENGSYELTQIKVSDYFTDSHFGKGLNNQDGVISLKEGDGNEYLIIGEDTISVVGVNEAILNSKNEVVLYVDNKYNDSTNYTNTQVSLINENIELINNNLSNHINTVQSSIDSEITNRENADNELHSRINTITDTISNLSVEDKRLNGEILSTNETIKTLESSINHKFEDTVNNITQAYTNADNTILQASKAYTDNVKGITINEINSSKVRDVKYNSGEKKIYLEYSNNTYSEGFDASDFLIDGMLNEVSFNNDTNEIIFNWNTNAGDKTLTVSLSDLIDVYEVGDESKTFLKINHNKIDVIIDKDNALASTTYVENVKNELTSEVTELSDTITTKLDTKISHEQLAVNGASISSVELGNNDSLIHKINRDNGVIEYFVPNKAEYIMYSGQSITIFLDKIGNVNEINYNGTPISTYLDKISLLETRVQTLETEVKSLKENNGLSRYEVESIINSYLTDSYLYNKLNNLISGTTNEIKVSGNTNTNKIIIGFDDNAIFGDIDTNILSEENY
jgi:hypothetical protein